MTESAIIVGGGGSLVDTMARRLPSAIREAGADAQRRFVEFFAANIRNPNTRLAYARAVWRFFEWCEQRRVSLSDITPLHVSLYVEERMRVASAPTVKQHLAAIRVLCDWLVVGQVLKTNPQARFVGRGIRSRKARRRFFRRTRPANFWRASTSPRSPDFATEH